MITSNANEDFGYPVLLSADFGEVMRGAGTEVSIALLTDELLRSGRILLQSRGGAGKTTTVRRVRDYASERGVRVAGVSLFNVPSPSLEGDPATALLSATDPVVGVEEAASTPLLIIIDGLNEAARGIADEVLAAADDLAARFPHVAVMVTDRLTRRHVRSRWIHATLGPIPLHVVTAKLGRQVTPAEEALYALPVYLSRALNLGVTTTSKSAIHEATLASLGFERDLQDKFAEHALTRYMVDAGRVFDIVTLEVAVGGDVVEELRAANIVEELPDKRARYQHHLVHDFLAARAAAKRSVEEWDEHLFEALTLRSSSFDALAMMLEQVESALAPVLIRRVYDYNLYGSAYMLAEGQSRSVVDSITTTEILVLLAEKRFDRFLVTSQQASDALVVQVHPLARELAEARSFDDVVATAVTAHPDNFDYQNWLKLFIPGGDIHGLLGALVADDGIAGWTAANSLRRHAGLADAVSALLPLLGDQSAVVRWRAVHVLGAVAESAVTEELFNRFESDLVRTVRYGALRSLVEHALRTHLPDQRQTIFERVAANAQILITWDRLGDEFERVLKVEDPPLDWAPAASAVVEELVMRAEAADEQDRWRRASAELRLGWAAST